jgi:hypothetical protein
MRDIRLAGSGPQIRIKLLCGRGILPSGLDPLNVAVSGPQAQSISLTPMHEDSRGSDGSRSVGWAPKFQATDLAQNVRQQAARLFRHWLI